MEQRTCIVDGCDKAAKGGACVMHQARMRRHGSFDGHAKRPNAVERIMRMVEETDSGCWNWTGYRSRAGYGTLRLWSPDTNVLVYKYLYEATVGPVASGMVLDHQCRNVRCVRPEHLRQVTNKQNTEHFTTPLQSNNSSGFRGVVSNGRGGFMVKVKHLGKQHHGGTYATAELAGEAAKALRLALHSHNELDQP